MNADELTLRREIMDSFAATGRPPKVNDQPLLQRLASQHVVALDSSGRILMAHPFAAQVPSDGAVVTMPVLERLARAWYGDRLSFSWRPRSREESQAVMSGVGLTGSFWQLS